MPKAHPSAPLPPALHARVVRVGAFVRQGTMGANRVAFSGRGLRPGRYRLSARATDAAGDRSRESRVGFTR